MIENSNRFFSIQEFLLKSNYIFLLLILSCNSSENASFPQSAEQEIVKNKYFDVNKNSKVINDEEAFEFLITELRSRNIGTSCEGEELRSNIQVVDKVIVYSSPNSYGDYFGIEPGRKFFLYIITINECYPSEQISGMISKSKTWWGIIQSGEFDGKIIESYSSYPQIVNNLTATHMKMITGQTEKTDSIAVGSDYENENLRLNILKELNNN